MAFNPQAFSAAGGASTFQTLTFSNANGVSFTNTNGQVAGSVVTTYRASNDAVGLNTALTAGPLAWTVNSNGISLNAESAAGTSSGFNGNLISGSITHNTAGLNLSLNHPAWLTTAMQSNAATISNINVSAGTTSTNASAFTFANLNGISFGLGTGASVGSITAAHNAITTGRASNDAIGLNTAQSNVTWTVNSSGLSLDARGYAGTGTSATNASITMNSVGLAISVAAPAAGVGIAAGTRTATTANTLLFDNANGITFGLNAVAGSIMTASHNAITTARASTDAIGLNTAGTNITWTANSSGLSINAAGYAGTTTAITGNASITLNSLGMQFNGSGLAGTSTGFAGANISGSITHNSSGINLSLSVAAPGAAAENNWIHALGANTAGNTTASGSTIGYSGLNLTLSGNNDSRMVISAPATSSIIGTGGISLSANGSTISIGLQHMKMFEPVPMLQANSTTYAPGLGTWYIQPLLAFNGLQSGRMNVLHSFGSTSNLFAASNNTSFNTATAGGASYSFALSKKIALFSLGNGTNSTRLESFWSSQWTLGASHSMGITVTNASQITGQRQLAVNYIASVNTDGATTGSTISATHNASFANSSTATSAYTSGMSSIYNMLSGALLMPIPFNTSVSAGNYWLGEMYSTASTTAGTSVNGASIWPMVNQVGIYGMASMSHRQWGSTASSTGSQYFPGKGIFSVVSIDPPTTIAFSDIRSLASHQFNYFNIIQSGMSV